MKNNLLYFYIFLIFGASEASSQENFKVMFYNLLNYPLEDAVPNREEDLEFILADYQPDLFLVCELNNSTGATTILNIAKEIVDSNFEMATYVSNTSDDSFGDQNDLQNLLYYNASKFILEEELIVPTDLRDFNVYKLKLNSVNQESNPIELYVVVCHLKASSGPSNAQQRFEMVQDLDAYLNTLPTDTNVLLGGDLNLYTATESAFQELLDSSNNITFADPPNRIGSWNNNTNYVDVFTQSTRTQSNMGGSTGGFDDRFDFILTSENMLDSSNITYVDGSYQVYGNNGLTSCYNRAINSSDCGTTNSEFSFEIRDALHNFSDHLPVTLRLEIDEALLSTTDLTYRDRINLANNFVNSELTLLIDYMHNQDTSLLVFNNIGQKVKSFQLNDNNIQKFDVSGLKNGLYYLLFTDSTIEPIKFIISN